MHTENPTDKVALYAWDEAATEFSRVVGHNELEIIIALLAELEDERTSRELWQQNCTRAEERIAELERSNTSQDDHINQQQDRIDSLEDKRRVRPEAWRRRKAAGYAGAVD